MSIAKPRLGGCKTIMAKVATKTEGEKMKPGSRRWTIDENTELDRPLNAGREAAEMAGPLQASSPHVPSLRRDARPQRGERKPILNRPIISNWPWPTMMMRPCCTRCSAITLAWAHGWSEAIGSSSRPGRLSRHGKSRRPGSLRLQGDRYRRGREGTSDGGG